MRAAIAADAARLCAVRATEETKQELLALVHQMKGTSSEDELFRLDLRFWEVLADGANNIAYRLALNTMTRSAEVKGALAVQWSVYELKKADYWLPVATAIASGDATRAESVVRETTRAAVDRFSASVGRAGRAATSPATVETLPPQPTPARRARAASHPTKTR